MCQKSQFYAEGEFSALPNDTYTHVVFYIIEISVCDWVYKNSELTLESN